MKTNKKQIVMRSDDIDGGWAWIVLIGSFLVHVMTYGMAWSTGVYNLVFLEEFGEAKSVTAWAGSMPTAMMYATGPISSMLTNKFGCRPVIMAGGLVAAVGLSVSFFAPNLYYLFFSFGALAGAGYGLAYIPAITAVSYYFKTRITLASGIAASGVGVGNFLYPALIRWLINMYSWQQSLLILGAVTLNVCVFGALVRPIDRVEIRREDQPILDISPFKKKGYIVLCVNNFLFCCGISAIYIHLTALAKNCDIEDNNSALLISGLGMANLIGRFGYGVIGQHINVFILYSVSFALAGICICIIPVLTTFNGLLCAAVAFGLFSGCFGTLLVSILIEILGVTRFANGYGCLLLFEAAGQLIGGPLAGALYDLTDSYTLAFVIGGCLCIVSAVVMVYPYWYSKQQQQNRFNEDIEITPEKEKLAASLEMGVNGSKLNLEKLQYSSNLSIKQIESMAVAVENCTASTPCLKC